MDQTPQLAFSFDETKPESTPAALGWNALRGKVFDRDGGVCVICAKVLTFDRDYNCGHVVDRVVGGPDHLDNLVAMCESCNQAKPVHFDQDEFDGWAESGDPLLQAAVRFFKAPVYVEIYGNLQGTDRGLSSEERNALDTGLKRVYREVLDGR